MTPDVRAAAVEVLQLAGQVGERATAVGLLGLRFASPAEQLSFQAYGAVLMALSPRIPSQHEVYLEAAALLGSGWSPGERVRRVAP